MVFFAMSCATTIYTQLDTVMLGFMKTDTDVGYYSAAIKIKSILVSVVTSLGVVLLPRASYYVEKGYKDEFMRIAQKAINFVVLTATPLMVYFTIFAKEGITFLSGDAYAGAIVPMQITMPALLLIGLTNIMGIQILVPLGQENIVLYSEIAGAVVNLGLNILLIPKMASSGAAIGTLMAESVVWFVQFSALRNTILKVYKQVRYDLILLALVFASAAAILVKMLNFNMFSSSISALLVLIISALLFFGVYVLFLTFTKEPLVVEIEKQIITKNRI